MTTHSAALSPLMKFAIATGNVEVVKSLLARGESLDARDRDGNTALMLAAGKGRADMCSLLLEAGANRELKNDNGRTALMIAEELNHADVARVLSAFGGESDGALDKADVDDALFLADWQEAQTPQMPQGQNMDVIEEVLRTMSAIATFSPQDDGEGWDEEKAGIIARRFPDEGLSSASKRQLPSVSLEEDEQATEASSPLSPVRQPLWDENEVALLLDTAEKIARGELKRPYAVRRLSQILRRRLAAKGIQIDEKTRNEAGIHLQLHWMELYLESGKPKNISKLFVKIARLKADAPDRYAALSRRAEEELKELGVR